MLKMEILFAPFFFFLCVSVSGQELLQILTLHQHDTTPEMISHSLGVSLNQENLNDVSMSILMAENWLKTHVLSYYPSTNITSIVASNDLLCEDFENQENISRLTVLAIENIHHSLMRWGLEKKIKVSVFITPNHLQCTYLQPVFDLMDQINSTFTLKLPDFSQETFGILSLKLKSMADLGVFWSKSFNFLSFVTKEAKPTSRKLQFIDYSVPSDKATTPLPPLIGVTSPSPMSSPPPRYLPPCNPHPYPHHGGGSVAAPPVSDEGVWCVAKPSVPSEKLQEAMDYACGDGGADCGPISPTGSCYFPDSIVAHASYAFNSYWQKNKKNGGSCGFGGTAMLINSDPSFLHCHFTLE